MKQEVLIERPVDFNYGYRMLGECTDTTFVSPETYAREQVVQACVPCDVCGKTVHFGPAVALLRDAGDPVLDDHVVNHVAWYHTSTWPDWPSSNFAIDEAGIREFAERMNLNSDRIVRKRTTQALHVGTYAAAIENMLRRMRNQSDAESQFHLFRVQLDIGVGRIEAGYRDENRHTAANMTTDDLDAAGIDAVRYLNVHEDVGSLSLAVRRNCVRAVQSVAIPILAPYRQAPSALVSPIVADELEAALGARPDSDGTPYATGMSRLLTHPGEAIDSVAATVSRAIGAAEEETNATRPGFDHGL